MRKVARYVRPDASRMFHCACSLPHLIFLYSRGSILYLSLSLSIYAMEEKLVEVSSQEVRINFVLGCKCRANVRLKSLSPTMAVAFKVQTSSPHKFLVNPPCGLIPPLSHVTFQVILKPQSTLPPSFPRSPSDRFLIKTRFAAPDIPDSGQSDYIASLFSSSSSSASITQDIRLKVAFVGGFLLTHAVRLGDCDAVKNLIKRQRSIFDELTQEEAESLIRDAYESSNSAKMVGLLIEAGLKEGASLDWKDREDVTTSHSATNEGAEPTITRVDPGRTTADAAVEKGHKQEEIMEKEEEILSAARRGELQALQSLLQQKGVRMNHHDQYGLTALHIAAIKDHKEVVALLINLGLDLDCRDFEGHAPLHLAAVGGSTETVEVLVNKGANVNAVNRRGATPLYIARAMGFDDISKLLLKNGASSTSSLPLS